MSVTSAWTLLVALSAGSTLAAVSGLTGPLLALIVLALAWGKAQLILNRYLGLSQAPVVARGFALALALFMAGLATLAAAAG